MAGKPAAVCCKNYSTSAFKVISCDLRFKGPGLLVCSLAKKSFRRLVLRAASPDDVRGAEGGCHQPKSLSVTDGHPKLKRCRRHYSFKSQNLIAFCFCARSHLTEVRTQARTWLLQATAASANIRIHFLH
jgi:hypothetical protein